MGGFVKVAVFEAEGKGGGEVPVKGQLGLLVGSGVRSGCG